MFNLGGNRAEIAQQKWRSQLDRFVDDYQTQLTALVWGLQQEWNDPDTILGLDLQPQPHFVACAREDLETLNRNTKGRIQEILGIIDGYQREKEVIVIAIAEGQIKLISFQPITPPPDCFAATTEDIDSLVELLEGALKAYIQKDKRTSNDQ
ncbi:MAG: hypothetical protein ACFCU5_08815 [Pleurocapsa sp.]